MSFLATPAAFAFTRIYPVSGNTFLVENRRWSAFVYLCALTTSGLIAAFGAVACFYYLVRRTRSLVAAFVGSATFALGTPVWGWATSFFSHATAASLLLMGLIALDAAMRRATAGARTTLIALASGLAFGAATAVEYTSLVPALIIGGALATGAPWARHPRSILGIFACVAGGAVAALTPALWYHQVAFGSPFSLPYAHAAVFEDTRKGFFGIRSPDFSVMAALVFGAKRGLLWISPVMLAGAWAAAVAIRRPTIRIPAVAASLTLLWYLVLNSGFSYSLGGWSTGPRYLTAGLAMMALPLGLAWPYLGVWRRRGTLLLLGLSVLINLACTAVDMSAPEQLANPLTQHVWPNLMRGNLNQVLLFKVLRMPGLAVLVPLLVVWALLGWLLVREAAGRNANRVR
jgi:hypothetical protein